MLSAEGWPWTASFRATAKEMGCKEMKESSQAKDLEKTWDMNAKSGGARGNHSEKPSHIEGHASMHLSHGFSHMLACEDSVGISLGDSKSCQKSPGYLNAPANISRSV